MAFKVLPTVSVTTAGAAINLGTQVGFNLTLQAREAVNVLLLQDNATSTTAYYTLKSGQTAYLPISSQKGTVGYLRATGGTVNVEMLLEI